MAKSKKQPSKKRSAKKRTASRRAVKMQPAKKKTAKKRMQKRPAKVQSRKKTKSRATIERRPTPREAEPTRTLKQEILLCVTPDEVYDAFTDIVKHAEFTGSPATGLTAIGETMTAWDGYITAKTIALEPSKRIVQEWTTSRWPADRPPSILELTLEDHSDGTLLTMTHSAIPSAEADDYESGWHEHYWEPLKRYFSQRTAPETAA